jgi:hypothetical protein
LNPNDTVCLSLYARQVRTTTITYTSIAPNQNHTTLARQYPPFDVSQHALARDAALVNAPFVPLRRGAEGVRARVAVESSDVALPVGGGVIASGK